MSSRVMRKAGNRRNPVFTWRDLFSTDVAAGSVNATTSTDGKATRTVTDTESKLSISGGSLVLAPKTSAAYGDPYIRWGSALARAAGLAMIIDVEKVNTSTIFQAGWDSNTSGQVSQWVGVNNGYVTTFDVASFNLADISAVTYKLAVVLSAAAVGGGAYIFIKGGAFNRWTLLWINRVTTSATINPAIANYTSVDKIRQVQVCSLPAPFNVDNGLATQLLAGARSQGDAFIHEADCLIGWTVTTLANGQQVTFRKQDATNYWRLDAAADGSIALQEVVDGSATSRGTGAASSIANGQRLVVIADGATIKVVANGVVKITYTSAANFATATDGSVLALGTGGAIADLVSWPRVPGSICQTILNRYAR